jgi:hypothetical protein
MRRFLLYLFSLKFLAAGWGQKFTDIKRQHLQIQTLKTVTTATFAQALSQQV